MTYFFGRSKNTVRCWVNKWLYVQGMVSISLTMCEISKVSHHGSVLIMAASFLFRCASFPAAIFLTAYSFSTKKFFCNPATPASGILKSFLHSGQGMVLPGCLSLPLLKRHWRQNLSPEVEGQGTLQYRWNIPSYPQVLSERKPLSPLPIQQSTGRKSSWMQIQTRGSLSAIVMFETFCKNQQLAY